MHLEVRVCDRHAAKVLVGGLSESGVEGQQRKSEGNQPHG
jgi:hypothetical protein